MLSLLYGVAFLVLLTMAFRMMRHGWQSSAQAEPQVVSSGDRTGLLTIHPELLNADGQLTTEDLLTVRIDDPSDQPEFPLTHPGGQPGR